ncbi:hypothetical protein PAECIP111891_02720 [Paenibacillus allorhizoplanae]|uniref:Copper amine oxidase N-terminal domain-containing protein n=1 Tax=Paenibacillus allorhizoplanae TaxID=2905648 RepID=A0ABN8GEN8_9BACL|nr:hypothetical protein [Paenibacillus allorhizoplanae]CAH1205291.1 hypothetical protein PAECIP111891_02720 [Paenibacillus allorhizoplanae]
MKRFILSLLVLSLPVGVAGAATLNGDFEGNPIVQVTSAGQSLKVDELPAMIYKDHTVVPLSMLRQLGVLVTWDPTTYSVNVTMPQSASANPSNPAKQELENLINVYQWLKDTDTALLTFSQQLQQYANLTNGNEFVNQINIDYEELMKQYNESIQMALKLLETVSHSDDLKSIIKSESDAYNNVQQTKSLLVFKLTGNSVPEFEKQFGISLLNATRSAQKNLNNTNAIIHELQRKNNELLQVKSSNTST